MSDDRIRKHCNMNVCSMGAALEIYSTSMTAVGIVAGYFEY
jgi:hypothetical protein